ncbi:MAG: T9SS type A sorting domain-containing protein [Ignavibacteria bacterium]|nr:T9SS type A sorting domain-containing protein [Ignavibacteria bacterium]
MRNLILILLFSFDFLCAQWINVNPNPEGVAYNAVSYADSLTIWAAGDQGVLIKSTDKGGSWLNIYGVTSRDINYIDFFDLQKGFMIGDNGTIKLTSDGGNSWADGNLILEHNLMDGLWVDSNTILAAGEDGVIIKGSFEDNSWNVMPGANYNTIFDLYMKNDSIWAGGRYGELQLSLDYGESWSANSGISDYWDDPIYSITKFSKYYYAMTSDVNFLSNNSGIDWIDAPISGYADCRKNFSTDSAIYTVGYHAEDGTLIYRNGKKTFPRFPLAKLRNIDFYNSRNGVVVGTNGVILSTENDGERWGALFSGTSENYSSVCFPSDSIGYLTSFYIGEAAYYSILKKTTDKGKSWKDIYTFNGEIEDPRWIEFYDDEVGLISDGNRTCRTTDGGLTWNIVSGHFSGYNSNVCLYNEQNSFMTCGNQFYKSTDTGENWIADFISGYEFCDFNNIAFLDESNGFIVGDSSGYALVLKTTDGGVTWENKICTSDNIYTTMIDVCINDDSRINVLGKNGVVLRSADNFENYEIINIEGGNNLKAIAYKDFLNGAIVGEDGKIFNTINGGTSWGLVNSGTFEDLNSIIFTNEGDGWIAGNSGAVIKYNKDDQFLPVELISFNGHFTEEMNILNWATASEINSYGFEIERRIDGKDWSKIGFVQAAGNSSNKNQYSFSDKQISNGLYEYRLKQIDIDGRYEYSNSVEIRNNVPYAYSLSQNYPNPFNPSTNIEITIPSQQKTRLIVYNILGEQVAVLADKIMDAGKHVFSFNAEGLSSGVYFYRCTSGDFEQTKKMMLLQ